MTPAEALELEWDKAPEYGRRVTLEPALRRLAEACPGPVVVIETGTLRNESPGGRHGDGWSSLAWAWFAAQTGGRFHTVDIDPDCLDACRRVAVSNRGLRPGTVVSQGFDAQ